MVARPSTATSLLASHMAALVFRRAEPMLIPIPKSTSVPQDTRDWASFQVMIAIPGINISVIAITVEAVVEMGCTLFSVTQQSSSNTEMARSFFSGMRMGPSSAMAFFTVASPPSTSLISAGSSLMQRKKSTTDITAAYGAATINQCSQVIPPPSSFSINPSATIFCAAAVLIPMFQILAA